MSIHIPSSDGDAQEVEVRAALPDALPILPLRDSVPFPETLTPLAIGQERSVALVNDVLAGTRMLVMVASRDPEEEEPGPDDLYDVGVSGVVARMLKVPDGTLRILVHGAQRVEIGGYVASEPYLVARVTEAPDVLEASPELEALHRNVQTAFAVGQVVGPAVGGWLADHTGTFRVPSVVAAVVLVAGGALLLVRTTRHAPVDARVTA